MKKLKIKTNKKEKVSKKNFYLALFVFLITLLITIYNFIFGNKIFGWISFGATLINFGIAVYHFAKIL